MTREDYLDDSAVKQFIEWLRPHILGEDSFPHQYQMLRPRRRWRCDSLWGAFENYEWRGQGFKANQETLDDFADRLRRAVGCDDSGEFVKSAIDVLRWGGVVAKNKKTLCQLGDDASAGPFQFPRLNASRPRQWAECNVQAAWLVGAVAGEGPFGELPSDCGLRSAGARSGAVHDRLRTADPEMKPPTAPRRKR